MLIADSHRFHHTALRLYGVNCACRRVSCLRHGVQPNFWLFARLLHYRCRFLRQIPQSRQGHKLGRWAHRARFFMPLQGQYCHPNTTSITIISTKPTAKPMVERLVWGRGYHSASIRWMSSSNASGDTIGSKRRMVLPSLETRNLPKFHLMALPFSKPLPVFWWIMSSWAANAS